MKRHFLPLLIASLICATSFTNAFSDAFSDSALGTKAGAFLKMAVGARAIGMGSAFTGVRAGATDMIYWNPAGLATLSKNEASFMYASSFEDISYEWLAFAMPTDYGVFGAAVQHLGYGDILGRDVNAEPTSDFSPFDMAIYLTYARYFFLNDGGMIDVGANLKYIYSKIEDSASAFAVDAGAIFTLPDAVTSIGAVVQNAGTSMTYNDESEDLPLMFKIGASRRFIKNLLIALDINFPSDSSIYPSVGAEYGINILKDADIFLRAGYDGRQKDTPGTGGLNAGFGIKYLDFTFDYAFSADGDLGVSNRASLAIRFGREHSLEDAKAKRSKAETAAEAPAKPAAAAKSAAPRVSAVKTTPLNEKSSTASAANQPAAEAQAPEGGYGYDAVAEGSEEQSKQRNENLPKIAVVDFVSNRVPANERAAYSEIMRTSLYDSEKFNVIDNVGVKRSFAADRLPETSEITAIMQKTGADRLITASITKEHSKLTFEINVYDSKAKAVTHIINTEDSFSDARAKFRTFAEELGAELK